MSSSIELAGFNTVNERMDDDDDKFELQFALRKPVVDHEILENHTPTSRQGFSIRGFVAQVRSKDISKCWPFSEGLLQLSLKEGKHSLLPPLDSPQHGIATGPESLCGAQFTVPLIQDSQEEKVDDINGDLQENQPVIITIENEDLINSQITKADVLEAEECLDIVREVSSTAIKACGKSPLECNDAISNGHCDHEPSDLSDTLAEVPITEISNANGNYSKKNLEAEGCDIGDATKNPDGARSVYMKVGDLEEDELGAKECATTSPAINTVEEHTENCLSIQEKMSSKWKAQKKRRSIADLFACAPPVRTCGTSSTEGDVFVTSCPSPPLPLDWTNALSVLDSAKVNPFEPVEKMEIPPLQLQVGLKPKGKRRRAFIEENHGPSSSTATRLKDMIKSIVKHPRKERSFLKIAKEPFKSADNVDEVNPGTRNSNETEELSVPKKKKRQLSGESSKILKRKRSKTLAFQHSPKDPHVGTSENVQSYVEMQTLENKSNGLPRPKDAKRRKKRSSIIKKKQEPAKKQKHDMFLRDSKGRFAKITAVDSAKHVRRKGYRKLRRQKEDSLKQGDSSVHKDTNFAINLALSNARLGFLSDKAQTPTPTPTPLPSPSPCIDANTYITKTTEIPDLNAAGDTDQNAFATPEKRQVDSALELISLHRSNSLQMVNTLSGKNQSLGLGAIAPSSVAISNDRCSASSLATDPDKLHSVNRMNLASTETTPCEGMSLSHQKVVQRPCSQIEKYDCSSNNRADELLSVTHASRPDCQDLFLRSSPQGDKSVLGCQETAKVVRLMGKSLVIDTESVPQLNHGHTGFYDQPRARHRSKLLFENPSPTNRDRDTNELDLLQALESKQHCTAEEQGENPNNQFPEDLALSQPMKQHTTPPLRSKPVWLPGTNAAITGRRSDFPRSRFSGESHGIPRGYGGEKIGVRDDGSRSLGRRDSLSLSQSTVRDWSAHSIYGEDLSTPCSYPVRDGQPQNATFPAARYTSAATIVPSTFRNMHDQETVCIARDSRGVNLPLEPNMDVVFPVCVYDADVLPRIEPPGLFSQTSNNASFPYRDCHEGRLKYGKERRCGIEDGRTVNLIDKLHGCICKDVVAGADQDGRSGYSGNQVESASASQVDTTTVIDLTNDSEEENNETCDDTSRVRSAGKRHVRFVEADRFQPNRGVVFANNRIQGQSRKLNGGAKHILKPSTYSSSPNIRPSAFHYIFPFALEGKSMYLDH